jgi:hypothetical protein
VENAPHITVIYFACKFIHKELAIVVFPFHELRGGGKFSWRGFFCSWIVEGREVDERSGGLMGLGKKMEVCDSSGEGRGGFIALNEAR